jgi:hypothetical protein
MAMKNITRTIFMITLAAGIFSCHEDLLDPAPKTSFFDLVVFDTPSRVELQINGVYTFVKNGSFLGGRFLVYGDIRADDFLNRTANGVTGYGVWNHSLTEASANDVINLWDVGYNAINQANVFLDGMEANAAKFIAPVFPENFASVRAPQYIAEARLLRALSYYSLLQFYARPYTDGNGSKPGLPLRLKGEKTVMNNDLARSTVGEVYAQILADLNFAEQNLPLTRGTAPLNITRAHRNTAIALKTRVYLSMGDYANVITEANKIVTQNGAAFSATSGVAHTLAATIASVFAAPQETVESILSFPFTAQNAPGVQNQLKFYFGGEYSLNPAGIVANTTDWPTGDARRTFVTTVDADRFISAKYPTGTPFTDKAPVIRYSEVLLNLAEAIARTTPGVDAKALALLNAVRMRSQASFTWAPADNAALINAILMERRIEFLGEGLRNNDLMRLNATIPGKASIGPVAPTASNYIWPIPNTELSANGLMTRNE